MLEALASSINRDLFDGPQAAGGLVFQPTEERRRSGSHYTPRSLTRPIVEEALRPWLERCEHRPTAAQILDLKICDPAMGSGAFLVESCRYLAELLERSWTRESLPEALKPGGHAHGEEPLLYARRLIAQNCLYGVDKNPFAVNLARLSLWLVSLSKGAPFTFMDHALKCGNSLVGMERSEIEAALKGASLQRELWESQLAELRQHEARAFDLFHTDSREDADDTRKHEALKALEASTAYRRTVGDLLVAAFFNGKKPKDREELKKDYLAKTLNINSAQELKNATRKELRQLRDGEKGIYPLHWQLAFPDVFGRPEPGFDVFVGNPPFLRGKSISTVSGDEYRDWLQVVSAEGNANADLVAHFFRRCFQLLRPCGALGLIATNTIAQGDTRSTGLRWICLNGGTIYSARKRFKWPGVADVVVSVAHLVKGAYTGVKLLERSQVEQITAFLLANGGHDDPKQLAANGGKSFMGSNVLGMGFTFDDSGPADDETPGIPSPIAMMKRLIAENPKNDEVIFPYIGGEEVNSSPTHAHHRYVINFGERSEEDCRREWPELMAIVEKKVKPDRLTKPGSYSKQWWLFGRRNQAGTAAIACYNQVLATSAAAVSHHMINRLSTGTVFSHKLIIFTEATGFRHMCMQSLFHEEWSRTFGATQGSADALTYNPTDVFLGFPFPNEIREDNDFFEHFSCARQELFANMNLGPTAVYGKLHQPSENELLINKFRELHVHANRQVALAYGWRDVNTACGFGLDYLDTENDAQLPDALQERIDSGELFFWDANDALDFQGQLQAYGGITGRRKLPWRYRWPDAVRDDVLARLLALNAERYDEEVALGLHSKGGKKPAKDPSAGGKRAGWPAKAVESVDTEQIGLAL